MKPQTWCDIFIFPLQVSSLPSSSALRFMTRLRVHTVALEIYSAAVPGCGANARSGCYNRVPEAFCQGRKEGWHCQKQILIDEGITQGRQLTKRHWRGQSDLSVEGTEEPEKHSGHIRNRKAAGDLAGLPHCDQQ